MGVDARMFIKIKGKKNHLTAEEVLKKSVHLSKTIGHETFFIKHAEPHWKNKDVIVPARHALSIVPTYDEKYEYYGESMEDMQYKGKVVWFQDGDPIVAKPSEQFIEVHFWGRYYGPGYERGDWGKYRNVISVLKLSFPDAEIWYGGDSSGMCAELMDDKKMAEFDACWMGPGRTPYVRGFSGIGGAKAKATCPTCQTPMFQHGWGGGKTMFACESCDYTCDVDEKTGKVTKTVKK